MTEDNPKIRTKELISLKKERQASFAVAMNSFFALHLVALMMYAAVNFVQVYISSKYGIVSIVFFNHIDNLSANNAWTKSTVISTYSMPLIFSLLSGIFFFLLYRYFRRSKKLIKIYFIWGVVVSFALFFTNIIASGFSFRGIGVALSWLRFPKLGMVILSAITTLLLFLFGLLFTKIFLKLSPSQNVESHKYQYAFLFRIVFIPYFFSSILMFGVLGMADYTTTIATQLGLGAIVVGIFLGAKESGTRFLLVKDFPLDKFSYVALFACIAASLAALFLQVEGIKF